MEDKRDKVRSTAESALFYVGIPAALVYPLGVLGVGIQEWRDPLFPYTRLDTVWTAVALVPEKVVIGTGITLLSEASPRRSAWPPRKPPSSRSWRSWPIGRAGELPGGSSRQPLRDAG